jgi:hypothetical protein
MTKRKSITIPEDKIGIETPEEKIVNSIKIKMLQLCSLNEYGILQVNEVYELDKEIALSLVKEKAAIII